MSNDKKVWNEELARLFALEKDLNDQVISGNRNPQKAADLIQKFLGEPGLKRNLVPKVEEKFVLLVDLGVITVPDDYNHKNQLATFYGMNYRKFHHYNGDITDKHFSNPTHILKPGDKLYVRVFRQITGEITTPEERMTFLHNQKAVFTGAQGISLVFDQKRSLLPKGYCCVSLDESNCLWKFDENNHGVPYINVDLNGCFIFNLTTFELPWNDDGALLCFYEKKNDDDLLDQGMAAHFAGQGPS